MCQETERRWTKMFPEEPLPREDGAGHAAGDDLELGGEHVSGQNVL